jgi:hypothetical protein
MKIALQIADDVTGKVTLCQLSMHNAQKLYRTLGELIGDAQYQAKPGSLITVPNARIKVS